MKKRLYFRLTVAFLASLFIYLHIPEEAWTVQVATENQTALQDPSAQGTPDPNTALVWPIDLFAENIDPLLNGWSIKQGTGNVYRREEPAGSQFFYLRDSTSQGLGFWVQFPADGSPINSQKKYIVFNFRSTSSFALEVRIKVKTPGDTLKDKVIRYIPEDSSNYSIGDTLLVVPIGSAYKSGTFQTIDRNMETNLKTFFPNYKFQALNYVYVRGKVDISGIVAWNRFLYIEGYADSTSIKAGNPVGFKVSLGTSVDTTVSSNKNYHIEIYRTGAVGAGGLELKKTFSTQVGAIRDFRQDSLADSVFKYGTDWPTTDNVFGSETANWKSGIYVAKFIHDATGNYTWYPFVVRATVPGSTSKILVQTSNTTAQAYNFWGGSSFYVPGDGGEKTFDRPYLSNWFNPEHGSNSSDVPGLDSLGASHFFTWEFSFVKWLEGQGYVAEYTDEIQIHRDNLDSVSGPGSFIKKYNSYFSLGHDEYWSYEMRKDVELEFRNTSMPTNADPNLRATHNLAFLSGNTCFWKINFTTSDLRRILNLRTSCAPNCPAGCYDSMSWHGPCTGVTRPDNPSAIWFEQELIGARTSSGFYAIGQADTATALGSSHWTFSGTGLAPSDSFGAKNSSHPYGISGYETHVIARPGNGCVETDGLPDGLTDSDIKLLAGAFPSQGCKSQVTYYEYVKDSTLSKVFNGGAIQWAWGLDSVGDPTRRITKNLVDGLTSTFVGDIAQNMTWSGDIYLGGDVTIDAGATVTINPGARIFFFTNDVERTGVDPTKVEIIVKSGGALVVNGTAANPVRFVSFRANPSDTDWYGIRVQAGGSAKLKYCTLTDAYAGLNYAGAPASPDTIQYCAFSNCKVYGIRADSATNLAIRYCGMHSVDGPGYGILVNSTTTAGPKLYADTAQACTYGFYIFLSTAPIDQCAIIGPGNTGITSSGQGVLGDTLNLPITNSLINGYFSSQHFHDFYSGRAFLNNVSMYGGSPGVSPHGITATTGSGYLKVRNCTIADWGSAGVYLSHDAVQNVNTILGVYPSDKGYNNIYTGATDTSWKYVWDIACSGCTTPVIKAEWNDWNAYPPAASRFSGNVDYSPYMPPPPPKVIAGGDKGNLPRQTELFQNYPNPFNPTTQIQFALAKTEKVRLEVFNILGQRVRTLLSGEELAAGPYSFVWDGRDDGGTPVSSGLYVYKLRTPTFLQTKKMMLLK